VSGFAVLIPARYASTRFPGKPLADLAGRPMVVHVCERSRESGAEPVCVATDDERIAQAVRTHGFEARMTRAAHATGTERIAEAAAQLSSLPGPARFADLPPGPLRDGLAPGRFGIVVPLAAGGRTSGLLVVGDRASGAPYGEEDLDFAQALARQAQAALEGARLHQVALEKERQDRELQIAHGIQRSLFPRAIPSVPGLELAGATAFTSPDMESTEQGAANGHLNGAIDDIQLRTWGIQLVDGRMPGFAAIVGCAKSNEAAVQKFVDSRSKASK